MLDKRLKSFLTTRMLITYANDTLCAITVIDIFHMQSEGFLTTKKFYTDSKTMGKSIEILFVVYYLSLWQLLATD